MLGNSLQVHEHREEAPVACLVRGQHLRQVMEESGLPDPPLAGDHQAVAVERAEHAGHEGLAPVVHVVVEDWCACDVGIEAPPHGPPTAHTLGDQADSHEGESKAAGRGQEQRRLVEEKTPLDGDRQRVGEARGVDGGDGDLVQARLEGKLANEEEAPHRIDRVLRGHLLSRGLSADLKLHSPDRPVVGSHSLEQVRGAFDDGPLAANEEDRRLPVREPPGEEGLTGPPLRSRQPFTSPSVSGVEAEQGLEGDLGLRKEPSRHEVLAPGRELLDLGAQLPLETQTVDDLPRSSQELVRRRVLGVGGRAREWSESRLVVPAVEESLALSEGRVQLSPRSRCLDALLRGAAAAPGPGVVRRQVEDFVVGDQGFGQLAFFQEAIAVGQPLLDALGPGGAFTARHAGPRAAAPARW